MIPILCDEHDVEMVRNEMMAWWQCPIGDAAFTDEEMYHLTSKSPLPPHATEVRVVGCKVRKSLALTGGE